jgi:hypothetical protein
VCGVRRSKTCLEVTTALCSTSQLANGIYGSDAVPWRARVPGYVTHTPPASSARPQDAFPTAAEQPAIAAASHTRPALNPPQGAATHSALDSIVDVSSPRSAAIEAEGDTSGYADNC